MFTGIIEELGKIEEIIQKKDGITLKVNAPTTSEGKKIGQSIAINGACLTITQIENSSMYFDVIQESLEKTNLGTLKVGMEVNIEPAVKASQAIDGHIVQGHIDMTSKIISVTQTEKETRFEIALPKEIIHLVAFKGSITLDGISLTIAKLNQHSFEVAIIPHTLEKTNLKDRKVDDLINIEVDVLARYIERMLEAKEGEAKFHFLQERGFI